MSASTLTCPLKLMSVEGRLKMKFCDQRDDFNFHKEYISLHESMRYSRGSVSCENILTRGLLLKVIELRVSTTDRVTSPPFRKFYGCHHDLYCYENVCLTDDLDTFRILSISNTRTCVTGWSDNCLPFRSTWVHPCLYWGLCCSIFTFLCSVLWSIVCHCIVCPSEIYKFC